MTAKQTWPLAVLVLVPLAAPSTGWGLALGWDGLGIVTLVSLFGWFAASALWTLLGDLLARHSRWRLNSWVYGLLVILSGLAISGAAGQGAHREWRIADRIRTNQIEYFCHTKFRADFCVSAVENCPSCLPNIDKWKRDIALARLKAFAQSLERTPATASK